MGNLPRWGEGTDESRSIGTSRLTDPTVYTDPARLELEREHLFRSAWHAAGRVEAIPEPGDFLVWERFGQSVVIARQADRTLAAFYNACPHRGARIVSESGHCTSGQLTCPFHGIRYDLSGQVVGFPERATFDPARVEGLRAAEVALEIFEGWVFIHLDPTHAEPLERALGGLVDELGWYDMGDWRYYGSSTYVAEANWKSVFEGFLETWHAPVVHPSTIRAGIEVPRTSYASLAPHSMMVIPLVGSGIDEAPLPVEHRAYAVCHYLVFPFAFFNLYPDQGVLTTVYPIDESRTLMEGHLVAKKTAPKGMEQERWERGIQASLGYMDSIVGEDLHIAKEIGAVKHSFGYQGNLYNTLECRLTEFHREIAERIGVESPIRSD